MKILKLITVVILFCFNYSIIYAQIPINTFDISKTKPPKAVPANGMKIFYIVKAGENEFWQIVLDGAKKAAKHFGAKLIHQEPTSEFEISKQVSILETSFSTNPSAIVIAPAATDALVPTIEKAYLKGLPVIIIDSKANTNKYVSFIGSNNYLLGQKSADEMAQILKKEKGTSSGKVAAITYVSGVASLDDRINGFVDRIKEKYPDIKIVSIMDARGQVGNTIEVVKNLLTAHKDLNGLFANNQMTGDDMVRALDILKRKDLATIAIDTSGQEIWGVENGYLDAVLTQDPWHMGYFSVAYAIMARNGVPLPKEVDTGAIVITKEELNSKLVKSIIKPFEYYKDW